MDTGGKTPATIDEYIRPFSPEVRKLLEKMRAVIRKAAPEAEEKISYRIPTFYLHGNLVHFAAFKNHIGFYPTSSGTGAFRKELSAYKGGKGSVQFPLDRPLPFALIARIVRFRAAENRGRKGPRSASAASSARP
jgi:uncharacterized protein YdhG (YjbR/CyaY superfamily)